MAKDTKSIDTLTELDLPARTFADAEKAQALKHDVVRVLQAAIDLGNDPKTALYHVKNSPIRSFENKTALEMVEGGRTENVIAYLRSLPAGYVG